MEFIIVIVIIIIHIMEASLHRWTSQKTFGSKMLDDSGPVKTPSHTWRLVLILKEFSWQNVLRCPARCDPHTSSSGSAVSWHSGPVTLMIWVRLSVWWNWLASPSLPPELLVCVHAKVFYLFILNHPTHWNLWPGCLASGSVTAKWTASLHRPILQTSWTSF